jgi:hypothetical protein
VVQLLTQMSGHLKGLSDEVAQSRERVETLYTQGSDHLSAMREILSTPEPIQIRSDAFGAEATALMGVIADMQQTSVAPAVKRAAEGLSTAFIAPVADGRTADLASRQTAVVGRVETAVATQAKALAAAADQIIETTPVEPVRFQQISTAEAVLRYAGDFVPSWAGAIAIDLMPAVLVLILCVVHAGIRRDGQPVASRNTLSAADLITALQIAREFGEAHATAQGRPSTANGAPLPANDEAPREAETAAVPPVAPAIAPLAPTHAHDENVRPLSVARTAKAE